MTSARGPRPKVGLALGAGSARGLAHIGVLQVLEASGVPVDMIVGSSAGALVGGIYAACRDLAMMERLAMHIKWDHLVDFCFPRMGLIAGERILEFLRVLTGGRSFDDLSMPFAATAVDIETGEELLLREGEVALAIRASIAVPGIVAPVRVGGRLLVDGAVLDRVPARHAREMGADLVIAVSAGGNAGGAPDRHRKEPVHSVFEVITTAIELMELTILRQRIIDADVVIAPDLTDIGPTRLDLAAEIIDRGRAAARAALPRIARVLEEVAAW
ncbi:MAG: patatin-like phospholipase family protein [Firmicutes bacterium]|jgi:NTE family protein|nr:patatin-like phospholipase family protein [Bacillota bacterium]MDH7494895.1 patatin-like phospholipase family protein [Bacillota bacterium]